MYYKWIVANSPDTIGSKILIKSETFALKQDLQYPPPGVGGGGHVIIGIGEKKIRIIGIWEAKKLYLVRPKAGKFGRFEHPNTIKNAVF